MISSFIFSTLIPLFFSKRNQRKKNRILPFSVYFSLCPKRRKINPPSPSIPFLQSSQNRRGERKRKGKKFSPLFYSLFFPFQKRNKQRKPLSCLEANSEENKRRERRVGEPRQVCEKTERRKGNN